MNPFVLVVAGPLVVQGLFGLAGPTSDPSDRSQRRAPLEERLRSEALDFLRNGTDSPATTVEPPTLDVRFALLDGMPIIVPLCSSMIHFPPSTDLKVETPVDSVAGAPGPPIHILVIVSHVPT